MIVACQKTELKEAVSEDSSLNQLNALSQDYMNDHRVAGDQDRADGKWRRIIAADLTGALAGGATGGAVGALAGPGGVGVGALIGGVLGGAAASLNAADDEGGMAPGGLAGFYEPIYEIDLGGLTGNTDNPFNHIGYHHYLSITNHVITVEGEVSTDMSAFYAETSDHIVEEFSPEYEIESIYTLADCEATVEGTVGLENFATEVQELYDAEEISSTVHTILTTYAEVFDATEQEDLEDFVVYSVSAENIVNSDRRINDLDKQLILGTMATSRYGAQFWDFFITE